MYRKRIAALAALGALGALAFMLTPASTTTLTAPTVSVVRQLPAFEAVGAKGDTDYLVKCDGAGCPRSTLYSTSDEGATLPRALFAGFPSEVFSVTPLRSGTLLASTESARGIWRSTDNGVNFHKVLGLSFSPIAYQTLVARSIASDNTTAYVCTYNSNVSGTAPNFVWRSTDDGETWTASPFPGGSLPNVKHIHSCQVGPDGNLYVLAGDSVGAGVYVSRDHGLTFQTVCVNRPNASCTFVDGAFSADGRYLYAVTDSDGATIERLDLQTGIPTPIGTRPYEAFDAWALGGDSYVFGSTFEPADGINWGDAELHIDVVSNGVMNPKPVYSTPIPGAPSYSQWQHLNVTNVRSNGDITVDRSGGYGMMWLHINGLPAATTTVPATTTTASCNP
jgi:hypothetical protein